MYRYAIPHTNAKARNGSRVVEVDVKKGRKYFTAGDERRGEKYSVLESCDQNGNVFYEQETEYSHDYRLYNTLEAAKDAEERDAIVKEILKSFNLGRILHGADKNEAQEVLASFKKMTVNQKNLRI